MDRATATRYRSSSMTEGAGEAVIEEIDETDDCDDLDDLDDLDKTDGEDALVRIPPEEATFFPCSPSPNVAAGDGNRSDPGTGRAEIACREMSSLLKMSVIKFRCHCYYCVFRISGARE